MNADPGIRIGEGSGRAMYHVAVLLVPGFSLFAAINAVEALRITNSLLPERHFSWEFVHLDRPQVPSSSGMTLEAGQHLKDLCRFDALIVCASFDYERHATPETISLLRNVARHGPMIAGIETGVFFLAKAGMLDGRLATAHFNSLPMFAELFPKVRFTRRTYTFEPHRMTCAGGMSVVDMMLQLVAEVLDRQVAIRAAGIMIHSAWRDQKAELDNLFTSKSNDLPQVVRRACALMEETIREPVTAEAIARQVGVSRRTLDRLFRRSFECSAAGYHRMIRLARARKLIQSTRFDIHSISIFCGFQSYSHFLRQYREAYHAPPSLDRSRSEESLRLRRLMSPLHDLHPWQSDTGR